MKQKTFNKTAGIIMGTVATLHLIRAIAGWELIAGSYFIPIWVSWLAAILIGFLAFTALTLKSD